MHRRTALKTLAAAGTVAACGPRMQAVEAKASHSWLTLAVQQYSFNQQLRSGEMRIEDYAKTVVQGTGIKTLEYFNGHFEDRGENDKFFRELRKRSDDLGATTTMMLCRSSDALDSPKAAIRKKAVDGYRKWLAATKTLGGSFIRVDVRHPGEVEAQKQHAVAGLRAVCKAAAEMEMGILVENHGNHSSNGAWLADVMRKVALDNCGTLPDFQNFTDYDPYKGVEEMMPWAKIVCAKSKEFNAAGDEVNVDFRRMLKIVHAAKFKGSIGIEFEGHGVPPIEGINATKRLIKKVVAEIDNA